MAGGRRERAYAKGRLAEFTAAMILRAKGYRILAQRYRSPVGEIDLIARRRRRLVFAEVKYRATRDDAAWSVGGRQQARIARAAEHWLARNSRYREFDMSFDVLLLAPLAMPRHIQNAFHV